MKWVRLWVLYFIALSVYAGEIKITDQSIDTPSRLMALSLRGADDLWVSGTESAIFRSTDKGKTFQLIAPPSQISKAQFRDIEALNHGVVLVMSAGEGKASNIFRSADNGKTWDQVMQATHPKGFFNCMSFEDDQVGWLYGDSIDGQLFVLSTRDGGKSWQPQQVAFGALKNEGGFASSGTCINSLANKPLLVGAGNAASARLLIKTQKWQAVESPLKSGEAAGIFSLQRHADTLFVSGGSLKTADQPAQVFRLDLASHNWSDLGDPLLKGAIYGSALLKDLLFVSNPGGVSVFTSSNKAWQKVDESDVWAMDCDGNNHCWGVGAKGNVRRFSVD